MTEACRQSFALVSIATWFIHVYIDCGSIHSHMHHANPSEFTGFDSKGMYDPLKGAHLLEELKVADGVGMQQLHQQLLPGVRRQAFRGPR